MQDFEQSLANTVVDVSNVTLGLSATVNFDKTLPNQRKQKLQTANKRLHFLCFSGKWCRVERFHVPEKYVQALLADMPNAFINSAREKRHFRPPVWREKAKVYHYRDYEINDVISALGQQSAEPLKLKRSYLGDNEVSTRNEPRNARQALQEAKEKARSKTIKTPSIQIEIVVGHGEGRATREFEVIWWPDLFSGTGYGRLTLRFYVSKVLL